MTNFLNGNSVKAKGAQELEIAMSTPTPHGLGAPAIVTGKPGTGKTSFIESFGAARFPVVTLVASLYDATDFSGLPFINDGRTQFAAPEWSYAFDNTENGVLFFDEITTCPPSVQAALLRVILHRRVGNKSLPPRVRIVAAANPPDEFHGGFQLTAPLANRFVWIPWDLSVESYAQASINGFSPPELIEFDLHEHRLATLRWKRLIAAFLQRRPNLLHSCPAGDEPAFASPRSYEMAAYLMASCELLGLAPPLGRVDIVGSDSLIFLRLVSGCVGTTATTAFMGFLRNLDLPDPIAFLAGEENFDPTEMRDDAIFVFVGMLANLLGEQQRKYSESSSDENPHVLAYSKTAVYQAIRVIELICAINESGKIDSAFVPVKTLLEQNFLQSAVMHSFRISEDSLRRKLEDAMETLAQTELAKYIKLFPANHG